MSSEYNNFELMLPILIDMIKNRNLRTYKIPPPQANKQEIENVYNELNKINSSIRIIKYSHKYGIEQINTYCIYMVKYLERYWIVPYSKYNYNFEIDEYCPVKRNTRIDSLEDYSLSEEVFFSDDNIMDTSNTETSDDELVNVLSSEVYTSNIESYEESFKMDTSNVEDSEEPLKMETSYPESSYYTNILDKLTEIKNYIIQYEDT